MQRSRLLLTVTLLAGAPIAASAPVQQAGDVVGYTVDAADALTGGVPMKGSKAKIECWYQFDSLYTYRGIPAWRVRIEVDGKTVATAAGRRPPAGYATCSTNLTCSVSMPRQSSSGFWTPRTVGEHHIRCVLDSTGSLRAVGIWEDSTHLSAMVSVDVSPVMSLGKPRTFAAKPLPSLAGGNSSGHSGRRYPRRRPTSIARPGNVTLAPDLDLALKARPLEHCGYAQPVVQVYGIIKNVGDGAAEFTPGQPAVTITSSVGVYGGNIHIAGRVLPGRSRIVSVKLKSKAFPAQLAGAALRLEADVNTGALVSQGWGGWSKLRVRFPSNFCRPRTSRAITAKRRRIVRRPALRLH